MSLHDQFVIQEARGTDAPRIARMLWLMLQDMYDLGGLKVRKNSKIESWLESNVRAGINQKEHIFLIASLSSEDAIPIGFAEASVISQEPVFEPETILHIHSVYVYEAYRRKGVGKSLVLDLIKWGQQFGCTQAELNTLATNPARHLYETLGFQVFEFRMRRNL